MIVWTREAGGALGLGPSSHRVVKRQRHILCCVSVFLLWLLFCGSDDPSEAHNREEQAEGKSFCTTPECFSSVAPSLARSFPTMKEQTWCLQSWLPFSSDFRRGIFLVNTQGGWGARALGGVVLRIADRQNCDKVEYGDRGTKFLHRDREQSFLFTAVGHPAATLLSSYSVDDRNNNPTTPQEAADSAIRQLLRSNNRGAAPVSTKACLNGQGGCTLPLAALQDIPQYSAWSHKNVSHVLHPSTVQRNVKRIVEGYDFIVVMDRMEESLVALALILGIDVGDVLVTPDSTSCSPSRSSRRSSSSSSSSSASTHQSSAPSDEWIAMNYGDYLLHAAADKSLDNTIESVIGKDLFDSSLKEYKRLRDLGRAICAPYIQIPCTNEEGRIRDSTGCYKNDYGCGHECIDNMIADDRNRFREPFPPTQEND